MASKLANEKQHFEIYPNPSDAFFMKKNISENPAAEELLNIEITNLQGKVLLIKNVKQDTPVNIQTLTPGVYFIIITDAAGNKEVKKFVKIH